jgi:NADP-dependent 3-hydroxy acid dehydrogenase YdfG
MSTSPTQRESELLGQTMVVIGGSAGIGFETARRARAEGARLTSPAAIPSACAGASSRRDVAALAVHIMTNTALTGATYDVDGGQQLLVR